VKGRTGDLLAGLFHLAWQTAARWGALRSGSRQARRFHHFGTDSVIAFPITTLFNEHAIWVGDGVRIGPEISLSVGIVPGQQLVSAVAIRIGDRCLIGRGSGIVAHLSVEIGNDVWTGHHVYVTDQNHGYEDVSRPISEQLAPERPVRIGDGSWLGHGTIVLPGATVGRHVVVAAGSVVTGDLPDNCVAAGNPARVIRRYVDGEGWQRATDGD
jgi:carbonic anhydrase/acetyltransferase-like protein (isoleucine patch superfamily)